MGAPTEPAPQVVVETLKTNRASRRAWLFAGAAAVAASAGVAWQLHKRQASPTASADLVAELWQMRFAQPGGGELVMASLRGKPLVLNFWASWCAPCVREMPELDRFRRTFASQGWQVVGLAIDNEAAVVQFLGRMRLGFPVALAGIDGTELMMRLGNDKGGLPFTLVFDRQGSLVQRHLGETSYQQLEAWARAIG